MITYLIHTTSIWAVLFIVYKILLSKEKYFVLNRVYLLASLTIGLILPLVQFVEFYSRQFMPEVSALYHQQVNYISELSTTVNATATNNISTDWTSILFSLITIGMAVMLIRNIIGGFRINSLYQESEKIYHKEFTEVHTSKDHLPFSIFRYIFFSAFRLSAKDRLAILNHEIHHVRARHTWDVFFVEGVKVLFWWNPFIYLYKKAITENHEYAADHAAIGLGSRKEYCTLLLQSNMPGINLDLGNPFFSTYIKKRIDMMYRKNSTWKSYLKFVLPLMAIVFMAFMINEDKLELDYILASDHIDLYAGDHLLVPNVDYVLDRERGKIIVNNKEYASTEGEKFCMFIIDEPRNASYFQKTDTKKEFTNIVSVRLTVKGSFLMNDQTMTTEELIQYVNSVEAENQSKVKIKLLVDDNVKSEEVVKFLEIAFQSKLDIILEEENLNSKIPSMSPIHPKDLLNQRGEEIGFGMQFHPIHRRSKFHKGIDLIAKGDTPVFATADGVVYRAESDKSGYGQHVVLNHEDGYSTMYAHLQSFLVQQGDTVRQGDHIGFVGSTGRATAPHLHYEVRLNDKAVDPIEYGAVAFHDSKKDMLLRNSDSKITKIETLVSASNMVSKKVDQKLIDDANNMLGTQDFPNRNTAKKTLIKLGFNVNRGVIVKAGKLELLEGQDYTIDYQLGHLKILNEDYLGESQPITVEFASKESDHIMYNDNGKIVEAKKIDSDMTYDRECITNKEGVYFMAEKMPTLKGCDSGNFENDFDCSMTTLSEYANIHKRYPEALVKMGFEGMLMFYVVIDEKGNIESYKELLRSNRGVTIPALEEEGKRLLGFIKNNKKFDPATCNGQNVKAMFHLSVNYKLSAEQLTRVEKKDASNTHNANQRAVINYISDQGNMAYYYESDMNVPYTIKVIDPSGKVVLNKSNEFMYKSFRDSFFIPNKINGIYTIEVSQDGQKVTSKMKCELF